MSWAEAIAVLGGKSDLNKAEPPSKLADSPATATPSAATSSTPPKSPIQGSGWGEEQFTSAAPPTQTSVAPKPAPTSPTESVIVGPRTSDKPKLSPEIAAMHGKGGEYLSSPPRPSKTFSYTETSGEHTGTARNYPWELWKEWPKDVKIAALRDNARAFQGSDTQRKTLLTSMLRDVYGTAKMQRPEYTTAYDPNTKKFTKRLTEHGVTQAQQRAGRTTSARLESGPTEREFRLKEIAKRSPGYRGETVQEGRWGPHVSRGTKSPGERLEKIGPALAGLTGAFLAVTKPGEEKGDIQPDWFGIGALLTGTAIARWARGGAQLSKLSPANAQKLSQVKRNIGSLPSAQQAKVRELVQQKQPGLMEILFGRKPKTSPPPEALASAPKPVGQGVAPKVTPKTPTGVSAAAEGPPVAPKYATAREMEVMYVKVPHQHTPGATKQVEIIRNPTKLQEGQLRREARKQNTEALRRRGLKPETLSPEELQLRHTFDRGGNRYIWNAYDATHAQVAQQLGGRFGKLSAKGHPPPKPAEAFVQVEAALSGSKATGTGGAGTVARQVTPKVAPKTSPPPEALASARKPVERRVASASGLTEPYTPVRKVVNKVKAGGQISSSERAALHDHGMKLMAAARGGDTLSLKAWVKELGSMETGKTFSSAELKNMNEMLGGIYSDASPALGYTTGGRPWNETLQRTTGGVGWKRRPGPATKGRRRERGMKGVAAEQRYQKRLSEKPRGARLERKKAFNELSAVGAQGTRSKGHKIIVEDLMALLNPKSPRHQGARAHFGDEVLNAFTRGSKGGGNPFKEHPMFTMSNPPREVVEDFVEKHLLSDSKFNLYTPFHKQGLVSPTQWLETASVQTGKQIIPKRVIHKIEKQAHKISTRSTAPKDTYRTIYDRLSREYLTKNPNKTAEIRRNIRERNIQELIEAMELQGADYNLPIPELQGMPKFTKISSSPPKPPPSPFRPLRQQKSLRDFYTPPPLIVPNRSMAHEKQLTSLRFKGSDSLFKSWGVTDSLQGESQLHPWEDAHTLLKSDPTRPASPYDIPSVYEKLRR